MIKSALLGSVVLGLAASASLAADLPSRSAPAAVAPAPVFTWSGFYVGASVGAVGLSAHVKGEYDEDYYGYDTKGSSGGALVGVGFGYNVQLNSIVLGVEADFSGSMVSVEKSQYGLAGQYAEDYFSITTSKMRSFGTVRGRIGVAFDRTLAYVTGGVAFGNFRHVYQNDYDPQLNDFGSVNRSGWVVGAGIEHALTSNLSLKIEGLYADFGTKRYTTNDDIEFVQFNDTALVARVGLNYRFGASSAPVMARY